MLSVIPTHSRLFLRQLNCPSVSTCFTVKPIALYVSIICFSDVNRVDFFPFFITSAVPKCILRDVVIINGMILLIPLKSTASVTFLCRYNSLAGRSSSAFICSLDGDFLVIFPLIEPKFGLPVGK